MDVIVSNFNSKTVPFSFLVPVESHRMKYLNNELLRMNQKRFAELYKIGLKLGESLAESKESLGNDLSEELVVEDGTGAKKSYTNE